VVGVFTLGGTIAMTSDAGSGTGVIPRLQAADLLAAVPGLEASGIDLEVCDVRQLPGASLGLGDVAALTRKIQDRVAAGTITGAVVTQGTDTIEETSWLLDLLWTPDAPVVVTGAMRNPAMAGADGPANLLAAVQVAAAASAHGLGVLVVIAEQVHAAAEVRKAHSTSVTAFVSPNAGPVGQVAEGVVTLWRRPARPWLPPGVRARAMDSIEEPQVAVVPMTLGQDDVVLRAVGERVDGLVVAAFGVGHVPERLVDALTDLAGRIPVVLASRTGAGPVGAKTYAFAGSETDLLARGLIRSGYLDAYKARILLHVLLAGRADTEQIQRAFAELGGYAGQAAGAGAAGRLRRPGMPGPG